MKASSWKISISFQYCCDTVEAHRPTRKCCSGTVVWIARGIEWIFLQEICVHVDKIGILLHLEGIYFTYRHIKAVHLAWLRIHCSLHSHETRHDFGYRRDGKSELTLICKEKKWTKTMFIDVMNVDTYHMHWVNSTENIISHHLEQAAWDFFPFL